MCYNNEIFSSKKRQKMTANAFFSYVAQITNKNVLDLFLTDDRFIIDVIDIDKVYDFRLNLKLKKKKVYSDKPSCNVTGRYRSNTRFFGYISRFQIKEMVCEAKFLIGVSRFG